MGRVKELLDIVHRGGDEAVEAAKRLALINRWMPCSERVPDIITVSLSEVVLAWMPGEEFPQPAFLQVENDRAVWKWSRNEAPTHWMPMPDVPE
jgi:hypothetical protein